MASIDLALLGFGNVGRAFASYLSANPPAGSPMRISALADVSGGVLLEGGRKIEDFLEKPGLLVCDIAGGGPVLSIPDYLRALPGAGISALVECMPTRIADGRPALDFLLTALGAGVSVVTVDKGPLVHGFEELAGAARSSGARIAFTGTTGVRAPAGLSGGSLTAIRGILNGTTNFILTEMQERSLTFDAALSLARRQGIAEPDPTLDIEGWDTAAKILILAKQWMGASLRLEDVSRTGIGAGTEPLIRKAHETGGAVRLIGYAERSGQGVRIGVAPELLGPESPFHGVSGTAKGAVFNTTDQGEMYAASRSGRDAIARTILEDVLAVTAGKS